MKMIGQQGPGKTSRSGIMKNLAQSMKEVIAICITIEYLFPFNAANHDMVDSICSIYS